MNSIVHLTLLSLSTRSVKVVLQEYINRATSIMLIVYIKYFEDSKKIHAKLLFSKLLQYPIYFMFYAKQMTQKIFQNRRVNLSDKTNESKYIIPLTNSITTTIEKNSSKLNIKFVTTTSKTIKDLIYILMYFGGSNLSFKHLLLNMADDSINFLSHN